MKRISEVFVRGKKIIIPRQSEKVIVPPTDEEIKIFLKQVETNGWLNDYRVNREIKNGNLVAIIDVCIDPQFEGRKEVNFEIHREGKRDPKVLFPPFLLAENAKDISVDAEVKRATDYLTNSLLPFHDERNTINADDFVYEIERVVIDRCTKNGKTYNADLTLRVRTSNGKNKRAHEGSLEFFVKETKPLLEPKKPRIKAFTEFMSAYTNSNKSFKEDPLKVQTYHFINNILAMLINTGTGFTPSTYASELFSINGQPLPKGRKVVALSLEQKMFGNWFNYTLKKIYETKDAKGFATLSKVFPKEAQQYGLRTDFFDKEYLEIKLYNVPLVIK
ncbi:hypothetical protein HZA97_09895 [Candidatus Woesearchaeota archaeon]|nr:hypothetical protein [Candidatus Woesearchaeota archaeon]